MGFGMVELIQVEYMNKDKRLVPNEYESKWVNFIFKSFNSGMSVNNIRKELFKNGVKSRRGILIGVMVVLKDYFKEWKIKVFIR